MAPSGRDDDDDHLAYGDEEDTFDQEQIIKHAKGFLSKLMGGAEPHEGLDYTETPSRDGAREQDVGEITNLDHLLSYLRQPKEGQARGLAGGAVGADDILKNLNEYTKHFSQEIRQQLEGLWKQGSTDTPSAAKPGGTVEPTFKEASSIPEQPPQPGSVLPLVAEETKEAPEIQPSSLKGKGKEKATAPFGDDSGASGSLQQGQSSEAVLPLTEEPPIPVDDSTPSTAS